MATHRKEPNNFGQLPPVNGNIPLLGQRPGDVRLQLVKISTAFPLDTTVPLNPQGTELARYIGEGLSELKYAAIQIAAGYQAGPTFEREPTAIEAIVDYAQALLAECAKRDKEESQPTS